MEVQKTTMLIAHRGFGQNRMVDFEKALQFCQGVELDVRLTRDKRPIICHDATLFRTAQTDLAIRQLTYAEIKTLPYFQQHPEDIPPLFTEDFGLKIAHRYRLINVEIKADHDDLTDFAILETALKFLRQHTQAQIIISSFNLKILRWITSLNHTDFQRGYLLDSLLDLDRNLLRDFDYLHPYLGSVLRARNVARYQKLKKPLNIWTFNNQAEVNQVQKLYPKTLIYGYISNLPLTI